MSLYNDPSYLVSKQYNKSNNLNARIKIHSLYGTGNQNWHVFVRSVLELKPGYKLLAMGEGNGMQWRSHTGDLPGQFSAVLSDYSLGMIHEAATFLREDPSFAFVCFDAQNVPIKAGHFDVVTANHMLYHVPDPELAIQEAVRLLKPGGRFVAATNGVGHMERLQELLAQFEPCFQKSFRYFDAFTLESGLEVIKRYFETVKRFDFEENLWVTDAEDLADYAFSMPALQESIPMERRSDLVNYFEHLIDQDGGIFIPKSTGVLVGTKHNSMG